MVNCDYLSRYHSIGLVHGLVSTLSCVQECVHDVTEFSTSMSGSLGYIVCPVRPGMVVMLFAIL
jgi:hypothetical protein